jgi:HD superfamily phosphohydrolase
MTEAADLRASLRRLAPKLATEVERLADEWLRPVAGRFEADPPARQYPKTLNDAVWGVIELMPWEVALLDSPLLQRLRGVRQLGMAHLVYPGAGYDRLEHSCGVVEVADRMIQALERNADRHRRFAQNRADGVPPPPTELDRVATRLAALLHDVGHGPFSHATEPLIEERFRGEIASIAEYLTETLKGATKISPSEVLAVLFVMSGGMREIFESKHFGAIGDPVRLAPAVAARIVGSREFLHATYLSGVVSGPLDADKLDYMARDSHHSGFPVGLDASRLISQLVVVEVTPDVRNPELRKRAEASPGKRFFDIGISLAGVGAYEQMIVGRVLLYDRIYYHHKVRAAEGMARRLVSLSEEECKIPLSVGQMFYPAGDDAFVALCGGELRADAFARPAARSAALAAEIRQRRLYHRAFAFAERFVSVVEGLTAADSDETRAFKWSTVTRVVDTSEKRSELERAIFERAQQLAAAIPELADIGKQLAPEHVLVDFPSNKAVIRGDILTRTPQGHIGTPNLFFDPDKWSQAYERQKLSGFVFCPRLSVPLVSFAAKIVFYERFGVTMTREADYVAKVFGVIKPAWVVEARAKALASAESLISLEEKGPPQLVKIRAEDLKLPDEFKRLRPELAVRLESEFAECFEGAPASVIKAIVEAIWNLTTFLQVVEAKGSFVGKKIVERDLQQELKSHLLSQGAKPLEGVEIGGGETDIVFQGPIVAENKKRDRTADPFGTGADYAWQARRYSLAVCQSIGIVVIGYEPASEGVLLPVPDRIKVMTVVGAPEGFAQIRVVVPYNHTTPHEAKAPGSK